MKHCAAAVSLFLVAAAASGVESEQDEKRNNLRGLAGHEIPLVLPVIKCTKQEPCGECQGDCDVDADCEGDLVCFQKYGKAKNEEEATVPGKTKNICIF